MGTVQRLDRLRGNLSIGKADISLANGIVLRTVHVHIQRQSAGDRVGLPCKPFQISHRELRG